MFKTKRIIYVDNVKEMNKHIKYCLENRIEAPSEAWVNLQRIKKVYFTLDILYTRIILRYYGNGNLYTTYIFQLDGSEHQQAIPGLRTFSLLQRMSNKGVVDLTGNSKWYNAEYDTWNLAPIGGLIYFNQKLKDIRFENCIEYDRRSAYASALMEDIPDTRRPPKEGGYLQKGEIGFRTMSQGYNDEEQFYAIFEEGMYADYIYPAMESPFKKFAQYYYNIKLNFCKEIHNFFVSVIFFSQSFCTCIGSIS